MDECIDTYKDDGIFYFKSYLKGDMDLREEFLWNACLEKVLKE
jgi:hypothetical protein